MLNDKLAKKIDEAIASIETTESNKKLLFEIQDELQNAGNEQEMLAAVSKIIEFLNIFITISGLGSG